MTIKSCLWLSLLSLLWLLPATPVGATTYTLTTVAQGSGTIVKNPNNANYPSGVSVGLTATPSTGWYFGGWSGDATGTTNQINVVMANNLTVTGLFLAYPLYSVTLTTNGQEAIDLNPLAATY